MTFIVKKPSGRFLVVVSRKVASTAVQRNLIKRRLREAIHKFSTSPKGTFIALPPIVGKNFSEIKEEIRKIMKIP